MNTKTKLTALIITTCLVVACSLGIIAWAIAAANIGIGSKLSVTYEASPHVVCTASATYQKTTDTSATPFQSGTINMNYGDTSGSRTLNASSTALVLNDTNTYVVFEFTFTNNNKMNTMGINIVLTDNGTCKGMTRKYYFGDLSSSTIAQKESTIKSSGIDNSALSTKSVTLKQNQTTRIYMLLEITPGTIANYNADSTNKFLFTLTSVEVDPNAVEKVSYLSKDWKSRLNYSGSSYVQSEMTFTKDSSKIAGLTRITSVGTNSLTSTSAYVSNSDVEDVIAYRNSDWTKIVIYSPVTIFAPKDSTDLFVGSLQSTDKGIDFSNIIFDNFDTSKVEKVDGMFQTFSKLNDLDLGMFNFENVTWYGALIGGMYNVNSIVLPYNVKKRVSIQRTYGIFIDYYKDSSGNDVLYIGPTSDISNKVIGCSTKTNKVTITFSRSEYID